MLQAVTKLATLVGSNRQKHHILRIGARVAPSERLTKIRALYATVWERATRPQLPVVAEILLAVLNWPVRLVFFTIAADGCNEIHCRRGLIHSYVTHARNDSEEESF